jgi:hypothetical protein
MILTYPTNSELMSISQELLPDLTANDLPFQLFPIRNHDAAVVEWEQRDSYTGLMQIRGINGEPPSIPNVGLKRYKMEPGVYGEFGIIFENDIVSRRAMGSYNQPIDVSDLTAEKVEFLLKRRLDRLRWIIWTLLTSGLFFVPGPNGNVLHSGQFKIQTSTASVPWTTYATATPIKDLQALILLFRGVSAQFSPNSYMVMNRVTANALFNNANPADLSGRRLSTGATFNSIADINTMLVGLELPQVAIYDKGYLPDGGGAWTPFIPNGKVVMIGERPNGETMGEFQFTRNAVLDGAPGAYTEVSDSLDTGRKVPRYIRIDDGFNGGPAIFYPSLVIVFTAF